MYEHNALGYWLGLALCLTKVRSSRARCPATALITNIFYSGFLKHALKGHAVFGKDRFIIEYETLSGKHVHVFLIVALFLQLRPTQIKHQMKRQLRPTQIKHQMKRQLRPTQIKHQMRHRMGKPTICIGDNKGAD